MTNAQPRCIFCYRKMELNLTKKVDKNVSVEIWSCPYNCGYRVYREIILDKCSACKGGNYQ